MLSTVILVCGRKRVCDEGDVWLQVRRKEVSKEQVSDMPKGKGMVTSPHFDEQFGFGIA